MMPFIRPIKIIFFDMVNLPSQFLDCNDLAPGIPPARSRDYNDPYKSDQ